MTEPTQMAVEPKTFFDRLPPPEYLDEWIERLAQPEQSVEHDLLSLVIFRLHEEYLAVRTCCLVEVTLPQWTHVIPNRSNDVILGLVNIRGQLRICVSAHRLLGVEPAATGQQTHRDETADDPIAANAKLRMLILHEQSEQWAFPVEEVLGVHRLPATDLRPVPSTFGNAGAFSQSVFNWEGHTVGYLDETQFVSALGSACK